MGLGAVLFEGPLIRVRQFAQVRPKVLQENVSTSLLRAQAKGKERVNASQFASVVVEKADEKFDERPERRP